MMRDDNDLQHEPRSYTIDDLMAISKRQETRPWPAREGLQAVEEGYRRGYLDGWQHAVDAVFRLMQERGFTHMQAALSADAHHARALRSWRAGAHPDVLGDPLVAATFSEPRDYPPRFMWQRVRNPDDEDEESERGDMRVVR